ncbi:MAG: hypothetical protein KY396_04155, partial [Actinobacteria bacterium]|nr:hypothetical protein [Actinomycetota bacterium]
MSTQSDFRPRVAVIAFPGSNDDRDAAWALGALGAEPEILWHGVGELPRVGAVVVGPQQIHHRAL